MMIFFKFIYRKRCNYLIISLGYLTCSISYESIVMFISEGDCSLNRCRSGGQWSLQCGTKDHVLLFMLACDGHLAACLGHGTSGLTGATIDTDCGATGQLRINPGLLGEKLYRSTALCPYC
jgi:hypothetical protein